MERFMWMLKLYCSIMDPHIHHGLFIWHMTQSKRQSVRESMCTYVYAQEYKKGLLRLKESNRKKWGQFIFISHTVSINTIEPKIKNVATFAFGFVLRPISLFPSNITFVCSCLLCIALVYDIVHIILVGAFFRSIKSMISVTLASWYVRAHMFWTSYSTNWSTTKCEITGPELNFFRLVDKE